MCVSIASIEDWNICIKRHKVFWIFSQWLWWILWINTKYKKLSFRIIDCYLSLNRIVNTKWREIINLCSLFYLFFFPRSRLRDTAACTVNINIYTELLDVWKTNTVKISNILKWSVMGINAYRKTPFFLALRVESHCLPTVLLAHTNWNANSFQLIGPRWTYMYST